MPPQQPQMSGQYDFILNPQQPSMSKMDMLQRLPKAALVAAAVVVLLVIIILFSLIFSGGGIGGQKQLVDAAARAQEIARVSGLVLQQPAGDDTKALAATAQVTLTSEQKDIAAYLQSNKVKLDTKALGIYQNSGTDSQIQTAAQNNNLDQTYDAYLKQQLNAYAATLGDAYKAAGPHGKQIIYSAYTSVRVLLDAPGLQT